MIEFFSQVNDVLWTYVVLALLIGCAVYFTVRLRGMQFIHIKEMLRQLKPQEQTARDGKTVSSFQAFAISLSSRVGTGNLAGVASAICVGGPGAVFWMWLMALLGSATAFVEATLAQLYKRKGEDAFYGGPAYYMQHGLHRRWMGILFAVLITVTFAMANNAIQSNTICDAIATIIPLSKSTIGIIVTILTALVVFGGVQRIGRFSAIVVPIMAIGYIILSLFIVTTNISLIPDVISLVIKSAFGYEQAAGGMIGAAVMQGIKRGLFSNEAGEGSAPNAAATAMISHPIKQGFMQAFGVFIDTLVICTCTAVIILIAGNYDSGKDGILLTAESLSITIGKGGAWFLVIAIFLFAYSTIIANCFYGEANVRFITKSVWVKQLQRSLSCGMVMFGSLITLQTAWIIVDICMGLMTICNLIAIIILFPKVNILYKDYNSQRKKGINPVFNKETLPDAGDDLEAW